MKKKIVSWKRIVLNLFFVVVATIVLMLFLYITRGFFIIAFGISFLYLACPIVIRSASKAILNEKNKVNMQILHDIPVCFDKTKVVVSYVKLFFLFWVLPVIGFLLPEGLWILVFPSLSVICFAVFKLTEHTWTYFGWKKRTYWLLHSIMIGIFLLISLILRYLVII